jgi:8-oxo-dGTP pyrophosphatase MutT (NUDIX family)
VLRHFTASGVVLSGDDHVLLVEHRKLGWWLYPGGHIDLVYVLTPVGGTATPQLGEVAGCARAPVAKVPGVDTPPELPALIESAARYARTLG